MKEAIKTLFEATSGNIEPLNIDADILKSAMKELTVEYIGEGNYELAFKAAQLSEQPENVRKVFEAIKDQSATTDRVGIRGLFEIFSQQYLFFNILMASGTEDELRECAVEYEKNGYMSADKVITIYKKLDDSNTLLNFGKKLVKTYFETVKEEKKNNCYNGGTSSIPKHALIVFGAAKEMGAIGINKVLISFGDRLFRHYGYKKVKYDSKVPEAIQAYEMAGTPSSMKKAAEGYAEINNSNSSAELFCKIGDYDRAKGIILQVVKNGKFAEAMKLRAKLFETPASAEDLNIFMNTATDNAKKNVVQKIEEYLTSHDNETPFRTSYTFWHFSDSNDEWGHYLAAVHGLAARNDAHYYKPYPSIAKELYVTDKTEIMEKIHFLLQGHLLVGYILSALALEVEGHCPSQNRKYEHAFDAAFRTFSYGIEGSGYNPFDSRLDYNKDSDIIGLYEEIKKFDKECDSFQVDKGGWRAHTYESHRFLRYNSEKMQEKTRVVYKKLAEKIRVLLTQLS